MAYFPMFVDLEGRHVLVVGGGKIAARRVRTLLEFGCEITVVSPEMCEELREMLAPGASEQNQIVWKKKKYEIEELEVPSVDVPETEKIGNHREQEFTFVLAAAIPEINAKVVCDCRERKIPVNNASDRDQCDFYFPGIAKNGDTVVGITSGGGDHRLAAKISEKIRELLLGIH